MAVMQEANDGLLNGTTRVEIVPPPPDGVKTRQVTLLEVYNRDSADFDLTLEREYLTPDETHLEQYIQVRAADTITSGALKNDFQVIVLRQDQRLMAAMDGTVVTTKPFWAVRWVDLTQ